VKWRSLVKGIQVHGRGATVCSWILDSASLQGTARAGIRQPQGSTCGVPAMGLHAQISTAPLFVPLQAAQRAALATQTRGSGRSGSHHRMQMSSSHIWRLTLWLQPSSGQEGAACHGKRRVSKWGLLVMPSGYASLAQYGH
jgi:hypothetical protein